MECDSSTYKLFIGEFYNLISYPQWKKISSKQLEKYNAKFNCIKNIELAKLLNEMRIKDQTYYYFITNIKNESERKIYWDKKIKINKENQDLLDSIIMENGWPKKSEVGMEAASVAFAVVQHSDLDYMKKHFENLKNTVENNEANAGELALLTDRINISEGKKQIYGSQVKFDTIKNVYYLSADDVACPDSLNYRRLNVGLDSIENYLKRWNAELRF